MAKGELAEQIVEQGPREVRMVTRALKQMIR